MGEGGGRKLRGLFGGVMREEGSVEDTEVLRILSVFVILLYTIFYL